MDDQTYQLGQLTQAVKALTEQVAEQSDRLKALEDKYLSGRGFVFGALITIGFAIYGAKAMVGKLLGVL